MVDAVLAHVRDRDTAWPLPTSLLVDKTGNIQIVYLGPVSVETLIDDAAAFGRETFPANRRAAWPGRWYYRTPRNLESLANALQAAGLADDAGFYRQLWEQDRKQRRGR